MNEERRRQTKKKRRKKKETPCFVKASSSFCFVLPLQCYLTLICKDKAQMRGSKRKRIAKRMRNEKISAGEEGGAVARPVTR